jgi:hypothetical protein
MLERLCVDIDLNSNTFDAASVIPNSSHQHLPKGTRRSRLFWPSAHQHDLTATPYIQSFPRDQIEQRDHLVRAQLSK